MKLTAHELGLINFAMRISEEKNQMGQNLPKLYEKTDELDALKIFKKIKTCVKGKDEKAVLIDSDIELLTDEKVLLKKCLDRKWGLEDLEVILPLREKLNA